MNGLNAKIRRAARGQNVVEMALVLFVLAFLLIGIVDIGRAFHHYIVITNAAREGARYAAQWPDTDDDIKDVARAEAANSGVDLSAADVNILGTRAYGSPISVTVEYTYTTMIGGLVGLPEFPMHAATGMRYELDTD